MEEYQIERIEEYRERKKLSVLPFIIVDGFTSDFIWTGKWFKYVTIKEQRIKERYLEFDDGWSYTHYWGKWKYGWKFLKLIK